MEYELWRTRDGHKVMEFRCCGWIAQLMLSRLYPKRLYWRPWCPICGEGRNERSH